MMKREKKVIRVFAIFFFFYFYFSKNSPEVTF